MATVVASIFALLAACGVSSDDDPDKPAKPPDQIEEGQHFCCEKLGGNGSGQGCVTIDPSHISVCDKVLYCGGTYEKDGGKVTCL